MLIILLFPNLFLSFLWTNLAKRAWTTVEHPHVILIPKDFLPRFISFLQMWFQTFSKWKGNTLLNYKPTFTTVVNSPWAGIMCIPGMNPTDLTVTWHLRIFFKPSRGVSPLVEEPEHLILVHYFRDACMLTSPDISGLVSFASQYQVRSQWEAWT